MSKGIVIAGTMSGCGKTTVTLGLMAALRARGWRVAPFKVGPDFIDPGHHECITGVASRNLDGWMLSEQYNRTCFDRHTRNFDMAVVEGVMGLFDGSSGHSEDGSTAQMAKWLGLPVLLIVNAKSMARSAAALAQGFLRFDPDVDFAGILFNQIGSQRHLDYLKDAMVGAVDTPCWGGILRNDGLAIPERHLGLMTYRDHPLSADAQRRLAEMMEESLDLDALIDSLPETLSSQVVERKPTIGHADAVRIGVALDNAFCFYYPDNLDLLEAAGAELVYFSPIADTQLPEDLDGIYLGGGYPELFAEQLANNESMKRQIHRWGQNGMPIYGECGGFMYLCHDLIDLDGHLHPMAGCFDITVRMLSRLKSLGYREIRFERKTILGQAGQIVRGHEFHYSQLEQINGSIPTVYTMVNRSGQQHNHEGYVHKRILGSYVHLHFGSQPLVAQAFVQACMAFKDERGLHATTG